MKIAILDDYHDVARRYADWTSLGGDSQVRIFNSHIPDAQVEAELADFDVIVAMRERTPFPADRIQAPPAAVADHHRHAQQRHRHGGLQGARRHRLRRAGRRAGGHRHGRAGLGAHPGSLKHLPAEDAAMRRGMWQTAMPEPPGRRLGVVGLGKLGAAVARSGWPSAWTWWPGAPT